ncbi:MULTISPECIES: short chain dehydrogenase [unclassified Vibrio]|uniref:short chain dehydrogenase n=1 Tax=unclassified Vibrio TaxID=2614977 RepID=UPI0025557DF9|nr:MULTISPECIES: short chain dehydrogenase [unclassified Vibrio]MDK9779072.1 short chain dehydrogenase [Vibrio sp. D401a]MDK9807089.1 short chain dehydrogenase [Vibrio sp. D406a]
MKRVLVLGSTGLIGRQFETLLKDKAEVIGASFNHPENPVDLSKPESLKALFEKVGKVDAIFCTAGVANLAPWADAPDSKWEFGINNKMMGQINTIRFGEKYVNDNGVIVLTTGILAQHPFQGSGIVTTVNAAVEAAIKAAVTEIDRIRINAVSPGWVAETMVAMGMDPEPGMPAIEVAQHYVNLLEYSATGEIITAVK